MLHTFSIIKGIQPISKKEQSYIKAGIGDTAGDCRSHVECPINSVCEAFLCVPAW
ncbi:hypothetical protein U6A24_00475 [Aquimarina gracilis]|uniref:Bacteriocin-like protein n=1 Tax=Aquimarina gracilis TaxID=874422 RepID=A0ABU5ZP49_9FLAO|nr:hypothetical protein [Aquimarina gracilis]MEB3343910.1 hypothetical protein [Aquimarina gracilis]